MLLAAVKSLVRQMLEGTRSQAAPGCAYDLPVLAGWRPRARREAKAAPKAAAGGARGFALRGREKAAAAAAEIGGGGDDEPLLVVKDCEHFAPTVLDELMRTCAAARSADGRAALPLAFVFALARQVDAISRRVKRGTLVLLRAKRIALSGTQRAVDRLMSRLLCDRSLPRLSADGVDELLAALESDHCSMHASSSSSNSASSATSARSPSPSSCPSSAGSALRSTSRRAAASAVAAGGGSPRPRPRSPRAARILHEAAALPRAGGGGGAARRSAGLAVRAVDVARAAQAA